MTKQEIDKLFRDNQWLSQGRLYHTKSLPTLNIILHVKQYDESRCTWWYTCNDQLVEAQTVNDILDGRDFDRTKSFCTRRAKAFALKEFPD